MAKKQIEQTEIEAPYELPEGWKWCKLGELFSHVTGKALKKENQKGIKKRYITTSNIYWGTFDFSEIREMYFEENELDKCTAKKGDLLVCNGGDIGRSAIWNYDYDICLQNHVSKLRKLNNTVLPQFYYYLMLFYKNSGFLNGKGIGISSLSAKDLLNLTVPVSTLEEQQRIVNRIETLFAKLDQAKEKAQNVVDTFETRKASILHKAFNNQLKIDNGELKDEDWVETTIGECCKLGSGGTPSKSHPEYYENGDIPWLNTGEIDWNEISTVEKKITQIGVDNSSAKLYPAESVVVAMYGMGVTRGKAAIIKIPTTTNQAVCVLQTGEKINNRFLFYYFMCNYWNFREKAVGGNQLNYSATMISKWKIKLPPINYQLSIVNFLDVFLEKETKAKEAAEAVLEQIGLLKKSILARAFRGEL